MYGSIFLLRALMLLAAMLVASSAGAQVPMHPVSVEVHGQVRYASNRTPAENVLVRLERFGSGVVGQMTTDRLGKFQFSGLVQAQYVLTVHALGYFDVQQTIDLLTATNDYVNISLTENLSASRSSSSRLLPVGLVDANVPAEARTEFEKARVALSDGPKKRDKFEQGLRSLEKATAIYPKFLEAQLMLGIVYMDVQQWDRAEAALRRALEINPKATTALFALGELYRLQKRYDEAETELRQGLKLDARSYRGYLELGRVYWDRGDYVKAGPQVGRSLQLKPDYAEAHLLAGNILLRARQRQNALTEFQEYLRLAPKGEYAAQAREAVQKLKQSPTRK
ncbi:MAG: tetratricopeptide repeat protein [Acidobacteria bacterium]|nr:tetratricopeptide repeat protein [Acidobacteriota bacterium]